MLKIEHLTVAYDKKPILCDLSFSFSEQTTTGIIGTSGVGKTTLLNVLAGLIRPDEGTVQIGQERLAFIFQEPRLFPWMTALENVSCICGDMDRAKYYLSALLPEEAFLQYPYELSGGMKQRVSIARALAYEPQILLMDEPFQGLDPETKEMTANFVFDCMKGKTVLMVTHDEADLVRCHTVLRLSGVPADTILLEKIGNTDIE